MINENFNIHRIKLVKDLIIYMSDQEVFDSAIIRPQLITDLRIYLDTNKKLFQQCASHPIKTDFMTCTPHVLWVFISLQIKDAGFMIKRYGSNMIKKQLAYYDEALYQKYSLLTIPSHINPKSWLGITFGNTFDQE